METWVQSDVTACPSFLFSVGLSSHALCLLSICLLNMSTKQIQTTVLTVFILAHIGDTIKSESCESLGDQISQSLMVFYEWQ